MPSAGRSSIISASKVAIAPSMVPEVQDLQGHVLPCQSLHDLQEVPGAPGQQVELASDHGVTRAQVPSTAQ